MTNAPPSARQLIAAAIAAAGGASEVARSFALDSSSISRWQSRGRIPAQHIHGLCLMGNHTVKAADLIEAIGREAAQQAA